MNDYLKTIKLGYGEGTPGKQACWMTALSSHIGGEWTDSCKCVDPVINSLCIVINDSYEEDDKSRTEDILEFGLFEPLGTLDCENELKRAFYVVDRVIREWLPWHAERFGGFFSLKSLKSLKPIVDQKTTTDAYNYIRKMSRDYNFPAVLLMALCGLKALYAEDKAVIPMLIGRGELLNIASFCVGLDSKFIRQHMFPLLRQLIDMGKHGPYEKEPVCGVERFKELVGVK